MVYLPPKLPYRNHPKWQELLGDVTRFARLHTAQDKDTKLPIQFDPLPMQVKIFNAVKAGHRRILIVKARQVAATTACKMVLHHLAYTTPTAAMHAVISMRADSAQSLLKEHERWAQDLPPFLRRPQTSSKVAFEYADTGASIRAFTSRSKTGLRSYSPAAALISEAAYAPDLDEVLAQVDAAVGPNGLILMESTANNPGDFFSELIAGAPSNGWHLITHWWHEHPAYTSDIPLEDPNQEELLMLQKWSEGQVSWRRQTLSRMGNPQKFKREYPADLDDAFSLREGGFFDTSEIKVGVRAYSSMAPNHLVLEAPIRADYYTLGADPAGGVGQDYSTIAVVSVSSKQPVYVYRNNRIAPQEFAQKIVEVAIRYNNALVLCEGNNHGHAVLQEMKRLQYQNLWWKAGKPWTTTAQSKLEAMEALREAMPLIQVIDDVSLREIKSLSIPPGKVTPCAPQGMHDDSAMALALAYRAFSGVPAGQMARLRTPTVLGEPLAEAMRRTR